jgi:hypothetical protein
MLPVLLAAGGTVGAAVVPPNQDSVQLPACAAALLAPVIGTIESCEVFAIAMPVSKPPWFVRYGYSRIVRHMLIVNMVLAAVEDPMNLGMLAVLEGTPDVAVGAKDRLTVELPAAGELVATAET